MKLCFNGGVECVLVRDQEWNNSAQLMSALQIGKLEAQATLQLCQRVPEKVYEKLAGFCKSFG